MSGHRILVVEDNPLLRSAYVTKLSMEGFRVRAAEDGEEALAMAREFDPELIVLDLLMPRMNGIEFLRAYDVKGEGRDVQVIVFSNSSVPGAMEEAVELGAARVLTKSTVTPKELVLRVRELLGSD